MKLKSVFMALATSATLATCTVTLTGCNQPQMPQIPNTSQLQQQLDANGNPVAQQDGFDAGDAALGAVAGAVGGYMLGKAATPSGGSYGGYGRDRTVIVDRRPVYVTPSPRPVYRNYGSTGFGSRGITSKTTTTTRSRTGTSRVTTTKRR